MTRVLSAGLIGLALLMPGFERLRAQDWEGDPVLEVRHQPEEPTESAISSAALEEMIPQKAGQPYSAEKIRESIERLYKAGRFADIRVDARREPAGVVVTFLTKAAYFIGFVRVLGVDAPPTASQLHAATQLRLGQPFHQEQIPEVLERLRRALEDDGYFQAEIVPRYEGHLETQQMDVFFDVTTGERARLGNVSLTGSPEFPADQLLRQAQWRSGKRLTSELIQNGLARIRQLYRKENHLEASVQVARKSFRKEANEVDLEVEATSGHEVVMSLTGAEAGRSKLTALLPIFEEGALDEDLLREGQRNLRDYFESQGYFEVKVSYTRQELDAHRVSIEYRIDRGPRQSLEDIEISGNQYFRAEVLRERMRIEPASFTSRHGRFSSTLLEQDLGAIRALYQANGFQQVNVTSTLKQKGTPSENQIIVAIQIEEGPQTLVGKFSIAGNRSVSQDELEGLVNAAGGQPYSESVMASDRNILLTSYFNEGFRDTRFQWKATPSGAGTMDVEYLLDEGRREFVGHIFVSGLENIRRGVVNRQLQLDGGQPLSQAKLLDTQRRLYNLGVFNQVEMALQNPGSGEDHRNVLVYVEEARRYTMNVGLGVEAGRFQGSNRDVPEVEGRNRISPNITLDVSKINFGGRPHTVSVRTRFSTLQKRLGLSYEAPRFLNHEWLNAGIRTFVEETRDVQTFTARRMEGSLQLESKRSRVSTFLHRYSYRRVTIATKTLRIDPDKIPILSRPALVGLLDETWIRDTRDLPANARQGMFTTADLGLASKAIGSRTSFAKVLVQNSSYHPIGRRAVLARSLQVGLESPFPRDSEIPIAERFFSGGGSSHRGFALNDAGPRDLVTGFTLGGNALLLHSLELRFPVWKQSIGGALFHDAGNVFARIGDITLRQHQRDSTDFSYLSHAVGFGVRYQTPIGPVRFDLGYNLNPVRFLVRTTGPPEARTTAHWQFFFSVGQTF